MGQEEAAVNNLQRLALGLTLWTAAAVLAWADRGLWLGRASGGTSALYVWCTAKADLLLAVVLSGLGLTAILGWRKRG